MDISQNEIVFSGSADYDVQFGRQISSSRGANWIISGQKIILRLSPHGLIFLTRFAGPFYVQSSCDILM